MGLFRRSPMILRPARAFATMALAYAALAASPAQSAELARSPEIPLAFEDTRGQAKGSADFVARGRGYRVFLSRGEATVVVGPAGARPQNTRVDRGHLPRAAGGPPATIKMTLLGASTDGAVETEPSAARVHYLLGNDPATWRLNVPTHQRVRYAGVYPGIDVVFYGNGRRLEYDLVVAPGADPSVIRLAFSGLESKDGLAPLRVDHDGHLVLASAAGDVHLRRPHVYQDIAGVRHPVRAEYVVHAGAHGSPDVGFRVAAYDASRPLVIDPVLDYSTYLGGSGSDVANAVAVNASGQVYVAGYTDSIDFPGSPANRQAVDAFVTKLDATGSTVLFTAYVGGSGDDTATGVAVDQAGVIYVTGTTDSVDFPTLNGYQTYRGATDAFVTKLSADGSQVLYSTYLGGTSDDTALAIAVTNTGHAYVAGSTDSTDFPRIGSIQGDRPFSEAFVVHLDTTKTGTPSAVYSTYLGGDGEEEALGIVLDGAGNAYVVGWTDSTNFPRVNGYQGDRAGRDGFLAVLTPTPTILYSTYIGGGGADVAHAVALDQSGRVWVTGSTDSTNFPTQGSLQQAPAGGTDAFVSVYDPTQINLASLVFSTYLGGSGNDVGLGIAVTADGKALIAGSTASSDFPLQNPLHGPRGGLDAFVAKIDFEASRLAFSSYLGGSADDEAYAVATDASGALYVAGVTASGDFPASNGLSATLAGAEDAFVVKLSSLDVAGPDLVVSALSAPGATAADGSVAVTDTVLNQGDGPAQASTLRFYVSTDAVLDPADTPLGTRTVRALAAGENDTATTTLTLAAGLAEGHYFILARADADSAVWETDETNNTRATAKVRIGPDLVVTSVTVPAATQAGANVNIATVVANQGARSAGASTMRLYLSRDQAVDGSDMLLANQAVVALASGATSQLSTLVTIPASLATGFYYVLAKADADGEVTEADENNNTTVSSVMAVGADLALTSFTTPSVMAPGFRFDVTDTTENTGGAPAAASLTSFYLSNDTTLDAGDHLLASRTISALAAGESSTGTTSVFIPDTVTGPFYIIASANAGGSVVEITDTNNVRVSPRITLGGDLTAWVELPNGSGRAAPGATITVIAYTKNVGVLPAPATTTRIYLSTDETLDPGDTVLANRSVPALAPDGLDTAQIAVTLPSTLTGGSYYVIVKADAADVFAETNETNNFTPPARQVLVGADLIAGLDVPGTTTVFPVAGSFTVRDVTRNNGPVPAGASTTRFYLSADQTLDAGDAVIGSRPVPALAPDTENWADTTITLPANRAGRFYVIAKANADGTVAEADATNNTAISLPITVGPDLTVALDVPGSAVVVNPGDTIALSDTTHNQNGVPAAASVTRFYLSTDQTLDAGDPVLASRSVPALAASAQSTATTSVTLPASLGVGSYYIIAKANATGTVLESDTTNNVAVSFAITVGADLKSWIELPSGSTRVAPGGSVTATVSTNNASGAPAAASTTRVYLSVDQTLDAGDTAVLDIAMPALAGGATDTRTVTVTIPASLTPGGTYYLIAKADADDVVRETNEQNNVLGPARAILVGADLVVALDVPGTTVVFPAGGSVAVHDVTRNNSPVPAGASTTRFYLSSDQTLDAGDTLIGSRAVPALAPNTEHAGDTTLTFPAGRTGLFYVIAKANADGTVAEADSTNNTSISAPITIGADLVVALDVPGTTTIVPVAGSFAVHDVTRNSSPVAAGASTTRFYLSADQILDAGDPMIGSRAVPALGPNTEQGADTTVTLPAGRSGRVYIIAKANADGAVAEADSTNNTAISLPITIGPDFIVGLDVPGTTTVFPVAGSVTVRDVTRNNSPVPAAASTTRFYVSSDQTLDAADTLIGSRSVPALAADTENWADTTLTLPANRAGRLYVIAKANADGAVPEADSTNNTAFSLAITVGPDLTVALDVPGTAAIVNPGDSVTLSDTTHNQNAVPAAASITRFYLSTDQALDAGDVVLASRSVPAIGPSTQNTASTTITLPSNLAGGTYYIIAKADAAGTVLESDETNNVAVSFAVNVGADLKAWMDVPSGSSRVAPGGSVTATVFTNNAGGVPSTASVTRVYLSTDQTLDAGDVAVLDISIAALAVNATDTRTVTLTIPASLAQGGTYYLIAKADADDVVRETSEANNAGQARAIVVGADLIVGLDVPASAGTIGAGASVAVTDVTRNNSPVPAGASTTRFYLSRTGALDGTAVALGSRAVPALAPQSESWATTTLTLPGGIGGTFWIIAVADGDGVVAEAAEDNNLAVSQPLQVGANLVVFIDVAGTSALVDVGATITVTDQTRNDGAGAAPASTTAFYLSRDTTPSSDDALLGTRAVPVLAAGQTSTSTSSLRLPAGWVGVFYVIAKADASDVVPETSEANTTASSQIEVGPDLIVSAITAPARVTGGTSVYFSDVTKNRGGGSARSSSTGYYLSASGVLDGNAVLIGQRSVPILARGASSAVTTRFLIPTGIPAGSYTLMVVADRAGAVNESNETDNVYTQSITVLPDFTVPTLTVPTSADAGSTIKVTPVTRNQGAGGGSSTTALYLSRDGVLAASDTLLGTVTIPALAGATQTSTPVNVTLPAGLAGGKYWIIAVANYDGAVDEGNATNNLRVKTLTIRAQIAALGRQDTQPIAAALPAPGTERIHVAALERATTAGAASEDAAGRDLGRLPRRLDDRHRVPVAGALALGEPLVGGRDPLVDVVQPGGNRVLLALEHETGRLDANPVGMVDAREVQRLAKQRLPLA